MSEKLKSEDSGAVPSNGGCELRQRCCENGFFGEDHICQKSPGAVPSSPAPTPTGWISVEEKLPELSRVWKDGPRTYSESAKVLAFDASWEMRVATREGSGGWSAAGGDILHNVTHWMPLPSPPTVSSEKAEEVSKVEREEL